MADNKSRERNNLQGKQSSMWSTETLESLTQRLQHNCFQCYKLLCLLLECLKKINQLTHKPYNDDSTSYQHSCRQNSKGGGGKPF